MSKRFKVGDHVRWNSEAGRVSGVIFKKITSDTSFKGYMHHASRAAPQYLIKRKALRLIPALMRKSAGTKVTKKKQCGRCSALTCPPELERGPSTIAASELTAHKGRTKLSSRRCFMRCLLKVSIPVGTGNAAISDGSMPKTIESILADLKPECLFCRRQR